MNRQQLIDIDIGDVLGIVHEETDTMHPELVIVIDRYEPTSDYYLGEWEVRSYSDEEDTFWVAAECIRFFGNDVLDDLASL